MAQATSVSVLRGRWPPCCSKLPTGRTAIVAARSASSCDVAVEMNTRWSPRSGDLRQGFGQLADTGVPTQRPEPGGDDTERLERPARRCRPYAFEGEYRGSASLVDLVHLDE